MSLFTGNHVEKNRRCYDSIRCCTIATMDYGTDPISSFGSYGTGCDTGIRFVKVQHTQSSSDLSFGHCSCINNKHCVVTQK